MLTCLLRIPKALVIVGEERERTAAEKDAFEHFEDRVRRMDVTEAAEQAASTATVAGQINQNRDIKRLGLTSTKTLRHFSFYPQVFLGLSSTSITSRLGGVLSLFSPP